MNKFGKLLLAGVCILYAGEGVLTCNAQVDRPIVKERQAHTYRLKGKDSVLTEQTTLNYDEEGRLIRKQAYFYDAREPGILTKEKKASYDAANKEMTEHIIYYKKNDDPEREKLKTRYLLYTGQEATSKYVWRMLYDKFGDVIKEDTITYDADQNMIEKCVFDYRGNTSLYCMRYDFNRKKQPKRTRRYAKWTTISMKGNVVQKQAKRKDFRYKYNGRGQLMKISGKSYSKRFTQKYTYHANGKMASDITTVKNQTRNAKNKKYMRKDVTSYTYNEAGLSLVESLMLGEDERRKKTHVYDQDTLLTSVTYHENNGILVEDQMYEYSEEGKLKHSAFNKRHSNGKLRHTIDIIYNEAGQPSVEKQVAGKKILSQLDYEYNEVQMIKSIDRATNNGTAFERTTYKYIYYK
ncbi:MAG: hypothetical protein GY810_12930 [Aureispira sp.]|nr:hypothetical protein [Aureispira sp.]